MDTTESKQRRTWRRHSAEFKASMIEACSHTGVSIAAVALANGLNANLLRNWVVEAKKSAPAASLAVNPGFVPVALPAAPSS
ncbi:transposase, partial [Nevskia soli]